MYNIIYGVRSPRAERRLLKSLLINIYIYTYMYVSADINQKIHTFV